MFKSKAEFAKALIEGRRFKTPHGGIIYYNDDDEYFNPFLYIAPNHCGSSLADTPWGVYKSVVEVLPWYEDIPEHGVLCWVYDVDDGGRIPMKTGELSKSEKRPMVVVQYTKSASYCYGGIGGAYKYAIPITLEEVKKYVQV